MIAVSLTTAPPLDDLAGRLTGALLLPGSDDYVRLGTPWNLAVPSRPIAVAAVAGAADVVEVVRWAREHRVPVAVRATGHGAVDELDGTLLVHTGRLDELAVTPDGVARVGAGLRWDAVVEAAAPLGFAPLAGSAPHVGVAGFLTGGGFGPIARTFGLSSDRVRAFDVVTGDGEARHVTATDGADLFWALRGGKGSAGIVTAVEVDLLRLPTLLGGALYFDAADGDRVIRAWADWCPSLPEAATTSFAVLRLPALPGVPAPLAGRTTVAVRFAWIGDPDAGRAAFAPISGLAPAVFGGVDVMPSAAIGMIHADPTEPMPSHEQAAMLSGFPAAAADALLAVAGPALDVPQVVVEVRQLGGAVQRGGEEDGSFCGRDTAFSLVAIGIGAGPGVPAMEASAEAITGALASWDTGRRLPNFTPTLDPRQVLRVYDEAVLLRLAAVIEAVDPDGVMTAAAPVTAAAALLRS